MNEFIISDYLGCVDVFDLKGRKIKFESRYSDCFIITFSGKIHFSYDGGDIFADKTQPVFLPRGLRYTNECVEEAKSLVINFYANRKPSEPMQLSKLPLAAAQKYRGSLLALSKDSKNKMLIFSELYSLAYLLFQTHDEADTADMILNHAFEFMRKNYDKNWLTADKIAKSCFVSEIYLRKLFQKKYNTTPFKALTKIRMDEAYLLCLEQRPIKEIALRVGYSDLYQFSRAFKRYFKISPSEVNNA